MLLQSAQDPRTAEVVLRVAQNHNTATLTLTAASIAKKTPVVFATGTASLPSTSTDSTLGRNWIQRPATSTSIVNNLVAGLLAKAPGAKAYLGPEEVGLVQVYGPFPDAVVQIKTVAQNAGALLIPESLQFLLSVTGPMTGAASTPASDAVALTEVPALGGHFVLMSAMASSSATGTAGVPVFVRCM
jgi:hypothetical protein